MNRSLYGERDYAFGQRMLTLRTSIGLTQAGLAQLLRIGRKAVGGWEAGENYPKVDSLKALLTLAVQQRAFPPGREEEEIRAFWQAAHQKVLLDEQWLASLLSNAPASMTPAASSPVVWSAPPAVLARASLGPRRDWGEALDLSGFYDREQELATLSHWVIQEGCRLVSVLGMGGIGKSVLVVRAMQQLAEHFEVVLFRSLRDAPACEDLLESCLRVLAPEALPPVPSDLESRVSRLLQELRDRRVLLVLDNLESLLEAGDLKGRLRPGFEAYGPLLRRLAETGHQSCLLLTARERPAARRGLEGSRLPVRSLRLAGLDTPAGQQLLAAQGLTGSPEEQTRLLQAYSGNPLALKIVAQTIADLFDGQISLFLAAGTAIFGSIGELLAEQWSRLSPLEQTVLSWLAILREPVSLDELQASLATPLAPVQVLEAVDGLRRRSLLERGLQAGSFTLQSVVLEYITERLVRMASQEIGQGRLLLLREYGLSRAQAKEYVRQTQERLLLIPLLERLQSVDLGRAEVEQRQCELLEEERGDSAAAQGYGPANLVTLLRLLRGHLRGLDLSRLVLRGVSLQGAELQDADLSHTLLRECLLTQSFDALTTLAISKSGQYWATGSQQGEVRLWWVGREAGQRLQRAWRAHTDIMGWLAFSPDEQTLASTGWDGSVKLWDVERGTLRWSGWQSGANCLAFDPDGSLLASGGQDPALRLWDPQRGAPLEDLPHPGPVWSVAFSPDGRLLASGGVDGHIRLWQRQPSGPATCVQTLTGHNNWVGDLACSPDGTRLASSTYSRGVLLWEVSADAEHWVGRKSPLWIRRLAWSPDGTRLVGGGDDGYVYVWDATDGRLLLQLLRHQGAVMSVACSPDGTQLASGGGIRDNGELFVWDAHSGERLSTFEGLGEVIYTVAWHPVGDRLISGGSDGWLRWWDVQSGACIWEREAHHGTVYTLKVSPDGHRLASCGEDGAIRIWGLQSGEHLRTLRRDRPYERLKITGIQGLTEAEIATLRALGAVEDEVGEQRTGPEQAARR